MPHATSRWILRRVDANRFTSAIYRNGEAVTRCTIRLGGHLKGIAYSRGNAEANGFNENLSVEVGEQAPYLKPVGMSMTKMDGKHLSLQGAAEHYWQLSIESLRR